MASWLWDGGHHHHAVARARLEALGKAPMFICAVTTGEVEYGLGVSPRMDRQRHAAVRRAMSSYEVLPIGHHTGAVYGQIRAALFAKHSPRDARGRISRKAPEDLVENTTGKALGIQENDLWIVSVAVEYNLCLITGDRGEGMRRVLTAANYAHRAEFWPPDEDLLTTP